MIYTGNNLTPLWEENIAKHCEQNSMFVNVSCISSLPDIKHSIEEYLLEKDLPSGRTVFRHSDGPYRSLTYHSIDYIKNVWGRFLTIVEIIPKFHARQSVIILKKHEQPTT